MKRMLLYNQIPFDIINTNALLNYILRACDKNAKRKVFNMNTQGSILYLKNAQYRDALTSAHIIYPDGWGPVVASWFFPSKLIERVNVGDFIHLLLERLQSHKLSVFLIGCEKKAVKRTAKTIRNMYPFLKISGVESGFFGQKKEREILKKIRKAKPHLVLVGMGIPKQELFIEKNWNMLPKAVYMGIGGAFYYISQEKSRSPVWMRTHGLEWAYRFSQEPKRLWKRYTLDNVYFIALFVKTLLSDCLLRKPRHS